MVIPPPDAPADARPDSRSSFTAREATLLGLLALLWGNSFLLIKISVASISPAWIVAGRLTVGSTLLLGLVALRRRSDGAHRTGMPDTRRALLALAVIGTVGTGLPWLGQAWAQQFLDSGLVAVLNSTTPAATLAIAVVVGQEKLRTGRLVGLAVAIIGTLVIIGGEVRGGGPVSALLTAVGATFGYGLGTVLTRSMISGRFRPLPSAAVQLGLGAVTMTPVALLLAGGPPAPLSVDPAAGAALLALGVLGTGLAFLIYFTLIERVGATNASMVTYLVPIVGLVSGALVRGERFGLNVLLGAAILITGVYLAQRVPMGAAPDGPVDAGLPPAAAP